MNFPTLSSAALTDVGRCRKNNEDALQCLPRCGVYCVADGMGGAQGGEVASRAIVDALRQAFSAPPASLADSARLAGRALNAASLRIKAFADERGFTGAGSTVVVLAFDPADPARAVILHAGDSRAYRLRAGRLAQLTADHSLAAALGIADKEIPDLYSGVITRAVGLADTVKLDETPADVQPGDLFLLCTDGLNKMLSDRRLQNLLNKHAAVALPDQARALVNAALVAGGYDNVTVVLVKVG
jgi:serine/threonine protein phosphatase PrpC